MSNEPKRHAPLVGFNYRVMRGSDGGLTIVDAYYEAGNRVVAVVERAELDGLDVDAAREDLGRMVLALDQPLLEFDAVGPVPLETPCNACQADRVESAEFIERFNFDEHRLVYYDAPLAGFLQCNDCSQWYVFECDNVIDGLLWHWSMMAVDLEAAIASRGTAKHAAHAEWWLSVIEDYRGPELRYSASRIASSRAKPPTFSAFYATINELDAK